MYSEDYNDDEEIDDSYPKENFFVSFYRNNKVLVWILLGIILFIIIMSLLTKGGSNNNNTDKPDVSYNVKIEPSGDVVVSIGSSKHLIATVDGDAKPTIKWTSSDTNIATVDEGTVKAVNYGTATITAIYTDAEGEDHKDDKNVIVGDGDRNVTLTGVDFKRGDLFMPVGGKYNIYLILTPSNAFVENLSFASSDPSVVSVDNKGAVTAQRQGTATISYSVNNGKYRGELKAYVDSSYTLSEIIATPTKIQLDGQLRKIKIGEMTRLTYSVAPADASRSKFTWSSSNTSVVTVDGQGNIKGISAGNAVITVSAINGVNAKIDVEVEKNIVNVTDITVGVSELSMNVGEKKDITPVVIPDNASNKALTYSSSNESVAIVVPNNTGTSAKIYALTSGSALIYVRANNGIQKGIVVTVNSTSNNNSGSNSENNSGSNSGSDSSGNSGNNSGSNINDNSGSGSNEGSSEVNACDPSQFINGIAVHSSPEYVYQNRAQAEKNPSSNAVTVRVTLRKGVSYVLVGYAVGGRTCTPTTKYTSSYDFTVPKGKFYEVCIKKFCEDGTEMFKGNENYFNGAYRYYINATGSSK